ncbi:MAG TPA: DR2241 family protein [Chthoniobacterales bacterium]|jgi:sirohydrochlorin cobaltochelatase|nr:DR2241 family protein [Chthoniobacterales bacterium]
MPLEKALAAVLSENGRIGQLLIQRTSAGGFVVCHREDEPSARLEIFRRSGDALEIARYDDAGNYRPLKTAPNLRHGWRLELVDLAELRRALDYFYPGRLAMLAAWTENRMSTTSLRETLDRQSGMYRVAAKISDDQIDDVVGNFCKSDGGCLRTILWKRDTHGAIPSTKLPSQKFDPGHDQTGRGENTIPLLCQEACNLLVAQCRKIVKGEADE